MFAPQTYIICWHLRPIPRLEKGNKFLSDNDHIIDQYTVVRNGDTHLKGGGDPEWKKN